MKENVTQLQRANTQLDAANVGLLEALGAVIDADDSYTAGHSRQVAIYAGALADRLNLSDVDKSTVVKAALVHDIGKVGIDDQIVRKPGKLTAEEFAIMQKHTVIGAEILGRTPGLVPLVPLVRHHHERWDGRGYPDGIAGTEIPIGARILALSDSLDAMCSDRPYRARLNFEDVMAEVRRCAGAQFDPVLVEAVLDIAQDEGADFFTNSAAHVAESLATSRTQVMFTDTHYLKRSMIDSP
jgi:putative nucleotidyltransferase with HDIG domain